MATYAAALKACSQAELERFAYCFLHSKEINQAIDWDAAAQDYDPKVQVASFKTMTLRTLRKVKNAGAGDNAEESANVSGKQGGKGGGGAKGPGKKRKADSPVDGDGDDEGEDKVDSKKNKKSTKKVGKVKEEVKEEEDDDDGAFAPSES